MPIVSTESRWQIRPRQPILQTQCRKISRRQRTWNVAAWLSLMQVRKAKVVPATTAG